jgi:hypothetical protein
MKKIIILLMTVSIMLMSCGKSAGLSNSGKKAGNKTSLAGSDKKNLSQNTKDKNNVKQPQADTVKRYWHTATNFVSDHKIGLGLIALSLIALGSAYYYRDNISQLFSKIWKTSDAETLRQRDAKIAADAETIKQQLARIDKDAETLRQRDAKIAADAETIKDLSSELE